MMNGGSARIRKHRGSRLLVTTRLCEPMLKSTTGHEFDSSQPRERHTFEYNNLQDPHLRDYFYRPAMMERLIAKNFITPNLKVISSPRQYNAYKSFLDAEVTKIGKMKDQESKKVKSTCRKMGRYTLIDQTRDEKKRLYLRRQEDIVLAKRKAMEKEEMRIKLKKRIELEQQHIARVKNELKKHIKEAAWKMNHLQKKQEESLQRASASQHKVQEELEMVKQNADMNGKHLECIAEFESRWLQHLEDSSQDEEEIEEQRKELKEHEEELKEKEKAIVAKTLDEKEHKQKPPLETYLWMHLLEQQADIRQREWGEIRRYGLEGWEAVHRQWEQLQVQLRLRREAWRREHAKLLSMLMSEPSNQNARKLVVAYKKSASVRSKTESEAGRMSQSDLESIPADTELAAASTEPAAASTEPSAEPTAARVAAVGQGQGTNGKRGSKICKSQKLSFDKEY